MLFLKISQIHHTIEQTLGNQTTRVGWGVRIECSNSIKCNCEAAIRISNNWITVTQLINRFDFSIELVTITRLEISSVILVKVVKFIVKKNRGFHDFSDLEINSICSGWRSNGSISIILELDFNNIIAQDQQSDTKPDKDNA